MKGKTKTQKGITLIALIITIVVLLILAAVAISSITNDGILVHARNVATQYNQAQENESIILQEYLNYLENNNAQGVKLKTPNIVAAANASGSSPAEWEAIEGADHYEIIITHLIKDKDAALEAAFSTGTFHWDDTLTATYGYSGGYMKLVTWNATTISYSEAGSGDPNICVRAIPENTKDYASEWSNWHYLFLCLSGDTEITVYDEKEKRKRKKKLKDIKVGDKVITFNAENKKWEISEVIDCDFDNVKMNLEYDIWYFSDSTEITTVNRHRFYNVEHEKMMYMDEWEMGDRIYKVDGTMPQLIKHEHVIGAIRHYTLVTNNENYIANDCITGTRNMKTVKLNELSLLDIA